MKKRIGDVLVEMGFIDNDQIELAFVEAKKTGLMLGEVLLRLDWISEEELQMAIAVQSGAEMLNTSTVEIDRGLISQIPVDFVKKNSVFPFAKVDKTIKVATANPFDVIAKDNIARMTGCRVKTYLAPAEWVAKSIRLYYQTAAMVDSEIEEITRSGAEKGTQDENRIIRLAGLLVEKGHVLGASDIHVVPDINLVRVFYRVDGVLLQEYLFPKKFHQGLVTRFKIMGDMDISNPNIPHDGHIKYQGPAGKFDLRVSTFPTHLGETVVMRLLIYSSVVGEIEDLGFEKDELARFLANLKRPYGLILTTGPTGSGKTTTLYSALMAVNRPEINVMTVEDPIEYVIPTIRQTGVNPKANFTFSNALRAAMRQDPDIILVGEIRDRETAELAMRASITGHLVLSTLHTNDAASAINRLIDIGINPSTLASSLSMVVAQRLMRRICPQCLNVRTATSDEKELFIRHGIKPPAKIPSPGKCDSCHRSGYSGRTGIYEIMVVNRAIVEIIHAGALKASIEDAAVKGGTNLLIKQALKKVARGITSMEEVFRVVADA